MADVLVYVGGAILVAWGVAHVAPTRAVADSFGSLGRDNRRILVMEWVDEGVTHVFIGVLLVLVAALAAGGTAVELVYRGSAVALVALAVLTALTGARTPVVWFRVCPFVLTSVAVLLLLAGWV
jgi:hypothetical protein